MKENENGIVWNGRGRILDVLIETEIAIVWIENAEDRAIVKEGQEAGRAIENVDEAAIVCPIRISRRSKGMNDLAIGEIVIVIAIVTGTVREDVPGVTIAIVTVIARETSAIAIANVEIEKTGVIVKTKTRKKFELKKNLWMITLTIATLSLRLDHTLLLLNTRMTMTRKWKKSTEFQKDVQIPLPIIIMTPYKTIDLNNISHIVLFRYHAR